MDIVLGADGHVGSAVANELLRQGQNVLVVLHSDKKEAEWKKAGASVAIADVNDTAALHRIFKEGQRAFLLNPPAPVSENNVALEKASVASILAALEGSGIKKVVAESTYGAQPGDGIGDLGVLFEMEERLAKMNVETVIQRGAYYMSNWDMQLQTADAEGIIHSLYPVDFKLPMVAPDDLGKFAARFLIQQMDDDKHLQYVEGPGMYSANDVAAAFSAALGKSVKAVETSESGWMEALQKMGFSDVAAKAMAALTKLTLETSEKENPPSPNRGVITLNEYIKELVQKSSR